MSCHADSNVDRAPSICLRFVCIPTFQLNDFLCTYYMEFDATVIES